MNKVRIAINGFGRIGRSFFRSAFGLPEFDIVAINDLADTNTLAYLLKYDSVYGRYQKSLQAADGFLEVDGKKVKVLAEKDPSRLPWKDLEIDIVVESTGFFTSGDKTKAHLDAGAKHVVITAPASGEVTTALIGVNDDRFTKSGPITCNASCTTNSVAPVMAILLEHFGVEKAGMTTVHGYTATQNLVDGPTRGKDFRRGRAAGQNIVPSSTGAGVSVTRAVKELQGKFDGIALRVPVAAGSVADITFLAKRATSAQEINDILTEASQSPRWKGILKTTKEPLVSSDIIKEPYGAIVDLSFTRVVDGDLVKVLSWYDNEWGYAALLLRHLEAVSRSL